MLKRALPQSCRVGPGAELPPQTDCLELKRSGSHPRESISSCVNYISVHLCKCYPTPTRYLSVLLTFNALIMWPSMTPEILLSQTRRTSRRDGNSHSGCLSLAGIFRVGQGRDGRSPISWPFTELLTGFPITTAVLL